MSGRQTPDVGKRGCLRVVVRAEEQKVANGGVVDLRGYSRVLEHAVEGVTEDHFAVHVCEVEGAGPQLIMGAEQAAKLVVQNRKNKLAEQMVQTHFAPGFVSVEKKL